MREETKKEKLNRESEKKTQGMSYRDRKKSKKEKTPARPFEKLRKRLGLDK